MPRALILVDQDPEIKELIGQLCDLKQKAKEKMRFMQKQADDFGNECDKEKNIIFNGIQDRLLELGLLDKRSFDRINDNIRYDESGVLILEKEGEGKGDNDLPKGLLEHIKRMVKQ